MSDRESCYELIDSATALASIDWLNETTLEFRSKEKLRRVFSSNAMLGFKLPENPTGASRFASDARNLKRLRSFETLQLRYFDKVNEC
ncbi:hypothetical protein ARALYDRAFT_914899 [Arabidopsis lyrata subsp. lyrata]|uniref:Uncharacterized protein n=1 Tax=Arabidopsis lyrata subsp. lyrata TaxID=81972 RepID=D7MCY4_ARALL|nr:hypothetical protein ARALYDRAFT_914899 [Arabidopsis lyrata subsp. lyrata]